MPSSATANTSRSELTSSSSRACDVAKAANNELLPSGAAGGCGGRGGRRGGVSGGGVGGGGAGDGGAGGSGVGGDTGGAGHPGGCGGWGGRYGGGGGEGSGGGGLNGGGGSAGGEAGGSDGELRTGRVWPSRIAAPMAAPPRRSTPASTMHRRVPPQPIHRLVGPLLPPSSSPSSSPLPPSAAPLDASLSLPRQLRSAMYILSPSPSSPSSSQASEVALAFSSARAATELSPSDEAFAARAVPGATAEPRQLLLRARYTAGSAGSIAAAAPEEEGR